MVNCARCNKKIGFWEGYDGLNGKYCSKCFSKRNEILNKEETKKKQEDYPYLIHWIVGICIFIIIIGLIMDSNTYSNSYSNTEKIKNPYTNELKDEVCREIKIYIDYCYEKGIDIDTCTNQIYEKVIRIYELTNAQYIDILDKCEF